MLDCAEGTVKSRCSRGRARLAAARCATGWASRTCRRRAEPLPSIRNHGRPAPVPIRHEHPAHHDPSPRGGGPRVTDEPSTPDRPRGRRRTPPPRRGAPHRADAGRRGRPPGRRARRSGQARSGDRPAGADPQVDLARGSPATPRRPASWWPPRPSWSAASAVGPACSPAAPSDRRRRRPRARAADSGAGDRRWRRRRRQRRGRRRALSPTSAHGAPEAWAHRRLHAAAASAPTPLAAPGADDVQGQRHSAHSDIAGTVLRRRARGDSRLLTAVYRRRRPPCWSTTGRPAPPRSSTSSSAARPSRCGLSRCRRP